MLTKLKNFLQLEIMTIKQYFTIILPIVSIMAMFSAMTMGSILSPISIGMLLCTIIPVFTFEIVAKNNLDTLYATLSVKRETVVQGRYIFTLLLNVCLILFSFVLGYAGLRIVKAIGYPSGIFLDLTAPVREELGLSAFEGFGMPTFEVVFLLFALFILLQAIQMPIYFKIGYEKAQFISMFVFFILFVCYIIFLAIPNGSVWSDSVTLYGSGLIVSAIIGALIAIVLASYRLSVKFYKKHEF